ncbi:MAG: ABC transporter permease, partial [Planctomycetota bacterium]
RIAEASGGDLSLESGRVFLDAESERAASRVGARSNRVLVYLADTVKDLRTGREMPYSTVAGAGRLPGGELAPGEIVLNRWAAADLRARAGDVIELSYMVRAPGGLLELCKAEFTLARVIPTSGFGADPTLVPRFKGLTDAETMSKWDPPPDLGYRASRVRQIDEDYWKRHRAAPKAFVNLERARELWGTRFGSLTSVRFGDTSKDKLAAELLAGLDPARAGLVFRPVREEQLAAAGGSTDFGGLFTGFSMFLVAGAGLLVALLVRLAVEQRSRQIGVMLAVGFTPRAVTALFFAEGAVVLVIGTALGAALSVGYAWLMMAGLRTLWQDAVGTTLLGLHVNLPRILAGAAAGFLVGALAAWRSIAAVRRMRPAEAISGRRPAPTRGRAKGNRKGMAAVVVLVAAGVALPVAAQTADAVDVSLAFFAAGVCLLAAVLVGFRVWLERPRGSTGGKRLGLVGLAARNAARNPTRSMLTVGLLASAAFVLAAVGAMRGEATDEGASGGTGGYELVADFDVPLPYDLNASDGRKFLALAPGSEALWRRVRFASLRAGPGEDTSCLNLYRPSSPRLLGVPAGFGSVRSKGRFSFVSSLADAGNPWELLGRELPGGAIPAVADAESARWILHKGLGASVRITDEKGAGRELRIVALLKKSMFQSELLVSERDFLSLFPHATGYGRVLVEAPAEDAERVA